MDIEKIYTVLQELIQNFPTDENNQDLIQDIVLGFIERPPKNIDRMDDKDLRYYLSRVLCNNIYSKTSPYYYKYKINKLKQIPLEDFKE